MRTDNEVFLLPQQRGRGGLWKCHRAWVNWLIFFQLFVVLFDDEFHDFIIFHISFEEDLDFQLHSVEFLRWGQSHRAKCWIYSTIRRRRMASRLLFIRGLKSGDTTTIWRLPNRWMSIISPSQWTVCLSSSVYRPMAESFTPFSATIDYVISRDTSTNWILFCPIFSLNCRTCSR